MGGMAGMGGDGGGGQGGGGQGGSFPTECVDGQPPFMGPLCGTASSIACGILIDEPVSSNEAFRNDAPGIALDSRCSPRVVYSEAVGGFTGFHAVRVGPSNWNVAATPFPVASGGIAIGKQGESNVLVDDGAFGVNLFRENGSGWDGGYVVAGKHHATARGLVSDANGFLHGGVRTDTDAVEYVFFDVNALAWVNTPFNVKSPTGIAVAVSSTGDAHFAFWATVNSMTALHWRSPPQAEEEAVQLNSNGLGFESQMQSIAIAPPTAVNPTGVPHIVAVRNFAPDPQKLELVYATRDGVKSWPSVVIDSPQTFPGDTCSTSPPPTMDGQTCVFDYEEIRPIGIFAGPVGDVRIAYGKIHRMGTRKAMCFMPGNCFYDKGTETSVGGIVVAAVTLNQPPELTLMGTDIFFSNATAKMDRIGRIHIAGYNQIPGGGYPTVRYLVIGPKQ